jgi:hypothetical protein
MMRRHVAWVIFWAIVGILAAAPWANAGCCRTMDPMFACFNAAAENEEYCRSDMWHGTWYPNCSCMGEGPVGMCVANAGHAQSECEGAPSTTTSTPTTSTTSTTLCHAVLLGCEPLQLPAGKPVLDLFAPGAGRLAATLTAPVPTTAALAHSVGIVVARGKAKARSAGPIQLKLKRTRKGKRFLRDSPAASLELTVRYKAKGENVVTEEEAPVTLQP